MGQSILPLAGRNGRPMDHGGLSDVVAMPLGLNFETIGRRAIAVWSDVAMPLASRNNRPLARAI